MANLWALVTPEDDDQAKGSSLQGSNRDAQRVRPEMGGGPLGQRPRKASGEGDWALRPVAGER